MTINSATTPLGKLEEVAARDIWAHEAHNFTPWLADNLAALADELGIGGLTLVGTEHAVGPFKLDILAQTDDGRLVAIENQLEQSDHMHLGQCITYAAGVDAYAVVWVLPRLLDEHRAALDWLNEHTDEGVHFFGVELSVVRIGDSLPAPVFRAESRPNDWQKSVRNSTPTTNMRGWEHAHRALDLLPPGGWTTISEIASLVQTSAGWVGRHFYERRHEPATIRMFNTDFSIWKWARLETDEPQDIAAIRAELQSFGIMLDANNQPPAQGFHTAAALETLLGIKS